MASIGFKWLDILEKEFDKAFVELDLTIGDWESEEPDVVFNIRQKLCTLSSCFAQLTHKAQTIFQNSAKIEAELIHMRTELIECKSRRDASEQQLHGLLLQLHSEQLSHLPSNLDAKKYDVNFKPDVDNIRAKIELELEPMHIGEKLLIDNKLNSTVTDKAYQRIENAQLMSENAALRNSILALNSEVYGAKLAAKYLDKELAGRIQQLQLLGRELRDEVRDKLWRQLESEILLQRHKTVVRACRKNSVLHSSEGSSPKSMLQTCDEVIERENANKIRTVMVKRKIGQGLGISITGGREHGVPILISELEANGPAAVTEKLYIGDAILSVNEQDLRQACHKEAVDILQQQSGDCLLQVQYIAEEGSDNSLEDDSYNFRFFENLENNKNTKSLEVPPTPNAPRTPESSSSRCTSTSSIYNVSETTNLSSSNKMRLDPKILQSLYISKETAKNPQRNIDKIVNDNAFLTEINKNVIKPSANTQSPEILDNKDSLKCNEKFNFLNVNLPFTNKNDNSVIHDALLEDGIKDLIIFKDEEFSNTFNNSVDDDSFLSPEKTTEDAVLSSEASIANTASNESHYPKKIKHEVFKNKNFNFLSKLVDVSASNNSLCNPSSDYSLLNSDESYSGSLPVLKKQRDGKKSQKKHRKKYFGVKTLQSIFNKYEGYSDVSTTASDYEEEKEADVPEETEIQNENPMAGDENATIYKCSAVYTDTSPQFEENIHNILSDIFMKNFPNTNGDMLASSNRKAICNKKYPNPYGQSVRVGKALRLCPNDNTDFENNERKEKLLSRYVYNSNTSIGNGFGDPYFGTPV